MSVGIGRDDAALRAVLICCLAALVLCVWWLVHPPGWATGTAWMALMAAAWAVFGLAFWLSTKVPLKAAVTMILLGGVGLPLVAASAPPRSSDDLYRYLWDGRVQSAGVDPYQYPPSDPALKPLRDDFLWPSHSNWCLPDGTCTLINRPAVHTIYPPVAQAYFTAVHLLSPKGSREQPIQLAAALFAIATTVLLVLVFPKLGLDPRLAMLWAWCPLVALEAGNNAHLDVVGAFVAASALVVTRSGLRGTLLGLAIAVKLTPVLLGPSMLRRRPLVVIGAVLVTLVVVFLPHVLAAGPKVLGYIPGYLSEEGYSNGSRFALLAAFMPGRAAAILAALVLAMTAIAVWWRSKPDRPWDTAVVMTGVALLLTTPSYSWYATLLVLLVAFSGRVEWLAVAIAGYLAQYATNVHLSYTAAQRWGYGLAALVVIGMSLRRWKDRIRV